MENSKLINLKTAFPTHVPQLFCSVLEKTLSIQKLNLVYRQLNNSHTEENYFEKWLKKIAVESVIKQEDFAQIPSQGSLVIVANHPFGGLDGILIGYLLLKIRSDIRFLGNHLLSHVPEISEYIFPVDVFNGKNSNRMNTLAIRQAFRWVERGGALITFPAGKVSHWQPRKRKIVDPKWSPHIAAIIRKSGASVLPLYIQGGNSAMFQIMGLLNPKLRTALLPQELMNKTGKTVQIMAGKPLTGSKLSTFQSNEELIEYLKVKTYLLKNKLQRNDQKKVVSLNPLHQKSEPVIEAVPIETLSEEIENIPAHQYLFTKGAYSVYICPAAQIPNVLKEIGRLREITFRAVDEGTGKPIDLDEFDRYYLHLFLWNHITRQVVGAYRLGLTDTIIKQFGKKGLYTQTLFRFKNDILKLFENAIELGRSFIRPEYQKKHSSLALLWQGISVFIAQNPQYHKLFGPVSISQGYSKISKELMIRFLKDNRTEHEYYRYVKPRKAHRNSQLKSDYSRILQKTLKDIEDVSLLISEIEHDGKGIPILLKHYLKLDAKLLCFNVDKKFSDVLDGLVVVDLLRTEPKILKRLMGSDGYETYMASCRAIHQSKKPMAVVH
ncbi:MAG: GNAT family N-acetyltransferase [Caldithrix sp.]|nr:GNAT family N-acetyltransferase [Caldithrix sp.]